MKGFASSRAIIAGTQRITAHSVAHLIMSRRPGSGIWSQTLDAWQYGFSAPIIGQRDEATGVSLFFVQSEKFSDRYYIVCQRANGDWYFSGDEKLREKYLGKVQAMLQAEQAEAVEELAPGTPVPAALPQAGVRLVREELAERRARKLAAMKQEAFEYACARVRAIERRAAGRAA